MTAKEIKAATTDKLILALAVEMATVRPTKAGAAEAARICKELEARRIVTSEFFPAWEHEYTR